MARTQRDSKLDTKTARLRLAARREPYWRLLEEGRALGYRRLDGRPGTWTARLAVKDGGKVQYLYEVVGTADDYVTADGSRVLMFGQAQAAAREWFNTATQTGGTITKPLTVSEAATIYMQAYTAAAKRAGAKTQLVINHHILPAFGSRLVRDLTTAEITDWRDLLALQPAGRRRSKDGKSPRKDNAKAAEANAAKSVPVDPGEAKRKRQASVNRVLTILKAILNHAFNTGRVDLDVQWRRAGPFKDADKPKIRYLMDDEAKRLVAACDPDFRALVVAALLTGADYGELRTAHVRDLNTTIKTLSVSKKRGLHTLALTTEAVRHLSTIAEGRGLDDLLFARKSGDPWDDSHQVRRMNLACDAAQIKPAINFHILRHTFATRALRQGVPMHYVSFQLGHKNLKTTQRHYAHVIPSDAAEAIQKAMGDLNFADLTPR